MYTLLRFVAPLYAFAPIVVKPAGNAIVVTFVLFSTAPSARATTPSGTITL